MQKYVINRPDPAVMEHILRQSNDRAVGVILRLAWQAGLVRDEIQQLLWTQIDFYNRQITLPNRNVPISEELTDWFFALRESRFGCFERVVLSDRDKKPLAPQSISRLVRLALDQEGQTAVRLIDLRHDFVLRQLETHDWQSVSRMTGIEPGALRVHFAPHLKEKKISTRICRDNSVEINEFVLWKLLQSERATPVGVTLWLTWQLGLRLEEIITLTWEQVDLCNGCLRLPSRTVELTAGAWSVLRDFRGDDPREGWVLTRQHRGSSYDRAHLSKLVRAALIRGGLDNVTLRDLRLDYDIRMGGEHQITAYLHRYHSITRLETMKLLHIPKTTAYNRLRQMVKRGTLTQIGAHYYLRDTVVPPERHTEVILEYLNREGFAYRQDISRILRIDAVQCRPILQKMMIAEQIVQERQRYMLKQDA